MEGWKARGMQDRQATKELPRISWISLINTLDFILIWPYNIVTSKMNRGRLTQLVECHLDVVKVIGSSPITPTKKVPSIDKKILSVGGFYFGRKVWGKGGL